MKQTVKITCFEQQFNNRDVIVDRRVVKCRVAVATRSVDLGTVLEQQCGDLSVAMIACLVKWCPSSVVLSKNVHMR